MMTLEQVREHLADRNLKEVSKRTGVGYANLCAIANGTRANPSYAVLVALSDYLSGATDD